MDDVTRIGWRLTLEPMADMIAWSLLRRVQVGGTADRTPPELIGAGIRPDVQGLQALVARLVPFEDERTGQALSDPWSCDLTDRDAERDAAIKLGTALLPTDLRAELTQARSDVRHTLTIATRGWISAAPWDAVALDESAEIRLVERAQTWGGLSPALFAGDRPRLGTASTRRLAVVDPGPVGLDDEPDPLYPGGYPEALEALEEDGRLDRLVPNWDPMSADDFGALLREPEGWESLCYLGHIKRGSAAAAGAAGMVFQRAGRVELLTARSWIAEPERWPAPPRVGLIGCGSDDSFLVEQTGLPIATLKAGADFLTSTRWTLPSDRDPPAAMGTTRLAIAVLDALTSGRPERAMRDWQLAELANWRRSGEPESSPLLWASLVNYRSPATRRPMPGGGRPT